MEDNTSLQQSPTQLAPPVKVTIENQPLAVSVTGENTRKITLGIVLGWTLGIYALLWGIICLTGYRLLGIIILISGIIVFPPISGILKAKLHIELTGGLKWFIYFVLQTIGFFLFLADMVKKFVH